MWGQQLQRFVSIFGNLLQYHKNTDGCIVKQIQSFKDNESLSMKMVILVDPLYQTKLTPIDAP